MPTRDRPSQAVTALAVVHFNYSVLAPADQAWLRDQTAAIRFIARRGAEDVILLGRKFNEVRDRIGRGNWQRWLTAEFAWSYETARRFGRAASIFGAHASIIGRFDPSALYVLSSPSVSDAARELAVQNAEDGVHISQIKAREILNSCRPQKVTIEDTREVAAARQRVGLTEAAGPDAPAAICPCCTALQDLVNSSRSIRLGRHQDGENDLQYTMTVYADDDAGDGPDVRDHVFDDVLELLLIAAGREPTRVCGSKTCQHGDQPQPLFRSFTRNRSKPEGRSTVCRDCERLRVKAAKKKAKKQKREAQPAD